MDKKLFIENIDKIHTSLLCISRIKRNLKLDNVDAINYYKEKVLKNIFIY